DAAANGMFYPTGVATDGTHLVVADRMNHRVLVWNAIPTVSDAPADAVIGQGSPTGNVANGGSGPFVPVQDGLNLPTGVAIQGASVYVADTENNRVVRFASAFSAPFADAWIGQPDGATVTNLAYAAPPSPNVGLSSSATPVTSAATVLRPRGIAVAGGVLYVSERASNRVHMLDAQSLAHIGVLGHTSAGAATANE